jgi:Arc/MetJ family transcription regulator
MGTHMKTTIDISDDLLARAKREARRQKKTLRDIVEEGLRQRLGTSRPRFTLKRHPFNGNGRQAGAAEGQWENVRDLIYRLG